MSLSSPGTYVEPVRVDDSRRSRWFPILNGQGTGPDGTRRPPSSRRWSVTYPCPPCHCQCHHSPGRCDTGVTRSPTPLPYVSGKCYPRLSTKRSLSSFLFQRWLSLKMTCKYCLTLHVGRRSGSGRRRVPSTARLCVRRHREQARPRERASWRARNILVLGFESRVERDY